MNRKLWPLFVFPAALGLAACSSTPDTTTEAPPAAATDATDDVAKVAAQASLVPFPSPQQREGLLVERVDPNTVWTNLGLKRGDLIVGVDGRPLGPYATAEEVARALATPGKRLEVVRRNGAKAERLELPAPK